MAERDNAKHEEDVGSHDAHWIRIGGSQAIADNGAQSPESKEITARLVDLTGTTFDHYSPSGDDGFFKKRT
ncbi:hypothetical protein [Bradyrhizobium sp. UFLA05-112]